MDQITKKELEKKKKNEIMALAKELLVKGRSLLKKDQLIKKILSIKPFLLNSQQQEQLKNTGLKKKTKSPKRILKKKDTIKTKKERLQKKYLKP